MTPQLDEQELLTVLERLAPGAPVSVANLAGAIDAAAERLEGCMGQLADHGVRRLRDGRLRVPGGIELLADALAGRQPLPPALVDLEVLGVTGSTNDDLRQAIESGAALPRAVTAEAQVQGRGRRGRDWRSPVASNLYLSFAFDLGGGAERARGLSLAAGVVLAEAIAGVAGVRPALKWPNDLLLDGRKLGGILVELAMRGDRCIAVIGAGVNVRVPDYVGRGIDQAWAQLTDSAPGLSRAGLTLACLHGLTDLAQVFPGHGFDAGWRHRWQDLDAFRDRPVIIRQGADEVSGIARGIDDEGELLLDTAAGVRRCSAGEVSLRAGEAG